MPANQQYTVILEFSDKDRAVHIAELVKLMGVSSEATRRDLEYPDSLPVQDTWRTLSLQISEYLDTDWKSRYYHHCLINNIGERVTERRNIMNVFDIPGPVMTGPFNSHTVGAARVGRIILALLGASTMKTDVFLHDSFTRTYKSHGTNKILIVGIMGMATDDSCIRRAPELAKRQGLEVNIATDGIDRTHPSTAGVTLTDAAGSMVSLLGSGIGDGNILIKEVNGMEVPITGQHTTLIVLHRDTPGTIMAVTEVMADVGVNICSFRLSRQNRGGEAVMTIEIDGGFGPELNEKIKVLPNIFSSTMFRPVQSMKSATIGGFIFMEPRFNYPSVVSIVTTAEKSGLPISAVVLRQQAEQMERIEESMYEHMQKNYQVVAEYIEPGCNKDLKSTSRLTDGGTFKMYQISESGKSLTGSLLFGALYRALVALELNAAMGQIAAAPIVGSCGILSTTLLTIQEGKRIPEKDCVMSLFAVSAIGMIIANNVSLAGVQGGCQTEYGSAAVMAIAAIVELTGGTPKVVEHAIVITIKNILELVCNPVTGPVEVPYIKRNASGAAGTFMAAELALVGIGSVIPANEVIQTMRKVGDAMSFALKETAKGGLAATPTGRRLHGRIFGATREAHSGCSGCGGCSS